MSVDDPEAALRQLGQALLIRLRLDAFLQRQHMPREIERARDDDALGCQLVREVRSSPPCGHGGKVAVLPSLTQLGPQ